MGSPPPAPPAAHAVSAVAQSAYVRGIDVSMWQHQVDWGRVAGSGVRFAYLKASEGRLYADPTYDANRARAA